MVEVILEPSGHAAASTLKKNMDVIDKQAEEVEMCGERLSFTPLLTAVYSMIELTSTIRE